MQIPFDQYEYEELNAKSAKPEGVLYTIKDATKQKPALIPFKKLPDSACVVKYYENFFWCTDENAALELANSLNLNGKYEIARQGNIFELQ